MVATSSFNGAWLYGELGCQLYACGVGYFGLMSIITLAAIAVERYMVITAKPLSGSWKISLCEAQKVCVGVWIYCLFTCLPPLFGWSRYIPEGYLTSCSWDYITRSPANRAYYIYLLTLGFVLPVSVIAYCYVFILAAIVAHGREMASVKATGGGTSSPGTHRGGVAQTAPSKVSTTIRTAEIIVMLVALFLFSWTPYTVVTLIGQFGDVRLVTPLVASLPALFAKASVVYNPVVYGLSHPHFRSTVKQYMLSTQCRTAPTLGGTQNATSAVQGFNAARTHPSARDVQPPQQHGDLAPTPQMATVAERRAEHSRVWKGAKTNGGRGCSAVYYSEPTDQRGTTFIVKPRSRDVRPPNNLMRTSQHQSQHYPLRRYGSCPFGDCRRCSGGVTLSHVHEPRCTRDDTCSKYYNGHVFCKAQTDKAVGSIL